MISLVFFSVYAILTILLFLATAGSEANKALISALKRAAVVLFIIMAATCLTYDIGTKYSLIPKIKVEIIDGNR
jgi:fumarate reductase subunit C